MKQYKHHKITPELIKAGIEINGLDETCCRICDVIEDTAEYAIRMDRWNHTSEEIAAKIVEASKQKINENK